MTAASALDTQAIIARVDKAEQACREAEAKLSAAEQALIFLADFEDDNMVRLSRGQTLPVPFDPLHYGEGKYGRGFLFEPAQSNLLPPAAADVETDLSCFTVVNGGKFDGLDAADATFGHRVLSVTMPASGDGVALQPVTCAMKVLDCSQQMATLMASCYLKGPKDAKVKLEIQLKLVDLIDQKTKQPVTDRKPDTNTPQTVVFNGAWQRVTCSADSDPRLPQHEAQLVLTAVEPISTPVQMDRFQLELVDSRVYQHSTTWVPGGCTRPASTIRMADSAVLRTFPVHEGTIAFWTRSYRLLGLRKGV